MSNIFYIYNDITGQVLHRLKSGGYVWSNFLYTAREATSNGRSKVHSEPCVYKSHVRAMSYAQKFLPNEDRLVVKSWESLKNSGHYDSKGKLFF